MTRSRRADLLIAVCLVAAVAAVYWPVHRFPFVAFDDDAYVYDNPTVAAGLSPAGVAWAFTTFHYANYHPLTWVSWLFDQTVWGARPGPMHVENVLLHAASTVLLFWLFMRATGRRWPSAVVAAVFAVHPAHVESVAWVSERKDVLSTVLLLASAHAYVTFARRRDAGRPATWAYAGFVAAFAASLLSKSMGVTFPAVLLLLDVWPLGRRAAGRTWRSLALEKVPLVGLSVAISVATTVAQHRAGTMSELRQVPLSARLGNAALSYARYLGQTVWPHDLAAYYPMRLPIPAAAAAASVALLVGLTVAAVRVRRPPVLVGWLWFLGTLVPVLGLVQVGSQAMADRYLYVPMIGLTLVAFGVPVSRRWRAVTGGAVGMALVALAVAARQQTRYWDGTAALRDRVVAVNSGSASVHVKLGADAAAAGNEAEARRQFGAALAIDPAEPEAWYDLGNLDLRAGRPAEAAAAYRRSATARPGTSAVEANWGVALLQLHRPAEAYEHLRAAEAADPDAFDPHFNLGQLLLSAGDRVGASAEFGAAARIDPTSEAARRGLAACGSR